MNLNPTDSGAIFAYFNELAERWNMIYSFGNVLRRDLRTADNSSVIGADVMIKNRAGDNGIYFVCVPEIKDEDNDDFLNKAYEKLKIQRQLHEGVKIKGLLVTTKKVINLDALVCELTKDEAKSV